MKKGTKNYTKKHKTKQNKTKIRTGRNLRQMVKAKLYRQNHTKKHTHTHSQQEEKEKYIYIYIYIKKEESNEINKQIYQ